MCLYFLLTLSLPSFSTFSFPFPLYKVLLYIVCLVELIKGLCKARERVRAKVSKDGLGHIKVISSCAFGKG